MNDLIGVVIVVAWILSAVVGAIIGAQTGKAGKGALLGFIFGPIGWVMMIYDIGPFGLLLTFGVLVGVAFFGISTAIREDKEFEARLERERRVKAEPPPEGRESPRAAPLPAMAAATPHPTTPFPTPDPRAALREIERKYGAPLKKGTP